MSTALANRLLNGFAACFGGAPDLVARAPGRVNVIGEHTDYNDGFAMPLAIGRETRVAYRERSGNQLRVMALDIDEKDIFPCDAATPFAAGGWRNYVRGMVAELVAAGWPPRGGELAIAGDIDQGTGLSSSASLEVAVGLALSDAAAWPLDPIELALLAQRAECDRVGVRCGNLDQIASATAKADHALLIDCRSLSIKQVALPADIAVLIVQSGVVRGLADGEYNARRLQCEEAARILGVEALRDADRDMLYRARSKMDPIVFRRARHIVTENERVIAAARMLDADDLNGFGKLLRESQNSQRTDFEITVSATEELASLMNSSIGGCGGARQTGGGFGGAVIAVTKKTLLPQLISEVRAHYRSPSGGETKMMVVRPADGASVERSGVGGRFTA